MIQDNLLDPKLCSKSLELSADGRLVKWAPTAKEDGNVKTVLGNFEM